jgi:hypothetical protein
VKGRGLHGPVKAIYSKGFSVGAVKAVDFLSDPKRTKKKSQKTSSTHKKAYCENPLFFLLYEQPLALFSRPPRFESLKALLCIAASGP